MPTHLLDFSQIEMNFSHKFIAKLQLIDDLAQPRSPQEENEEVLGSSGLQQVSNVRCCAACVGKKEEHGLMGQSPVSWAFAQLTYVVLVCPGKKTFLDPPLLHDSFVLLLAKVSSRICLPSCIAFS